MSAEKCGKSGRFGRALRPTPSRRCVLSRGRGRSARRAAGAWRSRAAEQVRDSRIALAQGRQHLAPGALRRVLVLAEAEQPRAVAEAVALELVEADLDHELRPHGSFLESGVAPAARLGEAPLRRVLQQRLDPCMDL